ncbi:MAG: 50S ribosomal protein L31 [Candidatus Zixiibacteriota bacterium]
MKASGHPEYNELVIQCACGHKYPTRSTKKSIHVEICANCHPFFTGKQKLIDTAGRVDKFRRKYASVAEKKAAKE